MIDIALEWFGYLGRWGHVLAAITWIGTSFYFNWLDFSERPPKAATLKSDVRGEVHEMHGGSFYYHERYWPSEDNARTLAHSGPAQLTFLTGLWLVVYYYWLGPDVYLLAPGGPVQNPILAVAISALMIFLPWPLYHLICNRAKSEWTAFFAVTAIAAVEAYLATEIFNPRAAFVHVGAMLGTIMVANVHFVIVPNHIRMRRQIQSGEPLDTDFGMRAKRRSQHNNYMTLPVLFSMISIHFPLATGARFNWLVLILAMLAGASIRHYRNLQLKSDSKPPLYAVVSLLLLAGAVAGSVFQPQAETQDLAALNARDAVAFELIQIRCTVCHSAQPSFDGIEAPPGGIRLETLAQISVLKDKVYTQTIANKLMPPGNVTEMADAERATLAQWLLSHGAVQIVLDDE